MDSSDVIYRRTERSLYLSFMTLFMVGLSYWLAWMELWLEGVT